jgi:hypothetical protein
VTGSTSIDDTLIIGVDPGKVTGVAKYFTDSKRISHQSFDDKMKLYEFIDANIDRAHELRQTVVLAVERYTMGTTTRSPQPDALEIIGVMRWLSRHKGAIFMLQGAADAAQVGSRANLVRASWWVPSDPDQHRNKASAQVAYALMRRYPHKWLTLIGADGAQQDK